jgi:CBS domain containing-hemolysin-like protein
MDSLLLPIGIIALLLLSGFFSGSETALMSLSRAQLRRLSDGDAKDRAVCTLLQSPQRVLATILLGNLFVNTLLTVLMAAFLHRLFDGDNGLNVKVVRPLFEFFSLRLTEQGWTNLYETVGVILNIAAVTPAIIIIGELAPKINAGRRNLQFARTVARPLLFFSHCVALPLALLRAVTNFLQRCLMLGRTGNWDMLTADEVDAMLNAGTATGATSRSERELLERIILFGNVEAKEIMVPRTRISALSDTLTLREAYHILRKSKYNYLPVYSETIDEIWGVLPFHLALRHHNTPLADAVLSSFRSAVESGADISTIPVQAVRFIPPTAHLDKLLTDMRTSGVRMNVVVSEYGGTLGLITRNAILAEIIGTFPFSGGRSMNTPRRQINGGWHVNGEARLRSVEKALDVEFDSESETLAGYVMESLGRVPQAGDVFDSCGLRFQVMRTNDKLAAVIHITDTRKKAGEGE